jgi:hypothetical protein
VKLEKKLEENSFILANLDASGFFRVNYDENNLNRIISQLLKDNEVII